MSTQDSPAIRVLIADDHPIWRDGVRKDLEEAGIEVVGEASHGEEAVVRAATDMPDVVLMDLQMPDVGGVEATQRIVADSPHIRVVILSASGEETDVLEAVKAGAAGYLLKSSQASEIVGAVRRAAAGEPVFSASLAGLVLGEFRRLSTEPTDDHPRLTERETEVLKLVAKGYTYREIGEQLFISTKTVQNHVQNILSKLQLHRRYELMRYAFEHGID